MTKESTKDDPNYGKIVALQTDEEKMKSIWKAEEVVVVPEALDVVADARVRPEYDVKYKQYVGVEDTFLQVNAIIIRQNIGHYQMRIYLTYTYFVISDMSNISR